MSEENTDTTQKIMDGQSWGDPSLGGINEAFDRAFPDGNVTSESLDARSALGDADTKQVDTSATESSQSDSSATGDDKKTIVEEKPLIEEEFFPEADEKAAVEEEKKPDGFDEEAFDKETEDSTKGMEAKAGEKFKALRAELKEAKQKTVTPEVQKKLDELEMKAQEAEGLRTRLEEVSNQSAKLKMENSPEYDEQVLRPATAIFKKADELAALYEGDAAVLKAIVKERDRKTQNELIAEHLKDFSDFDRNEVYRMSQDFNGLLYKREELLADASKKIEQFEAARIQREEALLNEQRLAVQTIQKDIWKKYKDVIPGFVDENGQETADFKKLMGKSLSIDFGRAKGRDQAFAAFAGVVLPHAVSQIAALKRQLAEYEKAEGRSSSAAPRPSDGINSKAPSSTKEPATFMERMEKMVFS